MFLSADTSGQPIYQPSLNLVDAQISCQWSLNNEDNVKLVFYGQNLHVKEYVAHELLFGEQGGFKGWAPPATYIHRSCSGTTKTMPIVKHRSLKRVLGRGGEQGGVHFGWLADVANDG